MTHFIQVKTTVETKQDAEKIAQALIEADLAACVQISSCKSMYRWQGVVESAEEQTLTIKSRRDLFDALRAAIEKLHPYEVPEILATPILDGNREYLDWLNAELRKNND